ncbi:NAD(P)H-quinone oxidoreductase [Salinisphaera aquimarina]|uniref:NAD(P)H-quinone oxidoreductase n=1 Tax=Salinisphaera aquimarina TaxID=2094031 RepID=A0ABV7EUP4_9GAMM
MRAWLVEEPGKPEAMKLGELDTPTPGPHEVLVDIRAIGINRADVIQRMGGYPPPKGFDPRCPGLEYAGEVAAVGERVHTRKVGDAVMGLIGGAAYAEQLVTHERDTLTIPQHYDWAQAAAMPEAFLTAYRALFLEGNLAPGQWALVRGATSGVGQAGLQLIHALGSRSIATSRSQPRLDDLDKRFKAMGFDYGYDLGLLDGDAGVAEQVQDATGGAHVILDFVGGPVLKDNMAALRDEGRQVQVGVIGGAKTDINMGTLLRRRLSLIGMTMRSLPIERKIMLAQQFNDRLLPLFEAGKLKPVLDQTFTFEQAVEAHRTMEGGEHTGKLVLVRE